MESFFTIMGVILVIGGILYGLKAIFDKLDLKKRRVNPPPDRPDRHPKDMQ